MRDFNLVSFLSEYWFSDIWKISFFTSGVILFFHFEDFGCQFNLKKFTIMHPKRVGPVGHQKKKL